MSRRLYVGKLSSAVSEETLRTIFSAHGEILNLKIIKDRESNRSKGYGFVELSSPSEASQAIEALDGTEVEGQAIVVAPANPQSRRRVPGGGQGGGYGGSRGGRGGGGRRRF